MKAVIASLTNPQFFKFFIRLEDPTRVYFPGEIVNGRVAVQSNKIVEASCIKLEFRGKVVINIKRTKAFYICEKSIQLDGEPEFDPNGECQQFPFTLILPTRNLISNCSSSHCSVSYKLKASFQSISWLPDSISPKCSAKVNIVDRIDIANYFPPLIKPFNVDVKGYIKKTKKIGPAKVNIEISNGAVLKGQKIMIWIRLEHFAPIKNLEGVLIALFRKTSIISKNGKEISKLKIINASTLPILVDPRTLKADINTKITVPNNKNVYDDNEDNDCNDDDYDDMITPTIKSEKIHLAIEYFIEIIVDLSIKKTIYETSGKSNHGTTTTSGDNNNINADYLKLKERVGKYNVNFKIPIIIGTFDSNDLGGREGRRIGNQNNQSLQVPTTTDSRFNSHQNVLSISSVRSFDFSVLVPSSDNEDDNNNSVRDLNNTNNNNKNNNNNNTVSWNRGALPIPSAPSIEDIGVYDDELGLYYCSEIIQDDDNDDAKLSSYTQQTLSL